MIESWTIELEQRIQGSDESVERYVSALQKLFTRVGGYDEIRKTRKFISGLTRDLYIMVQSTHNVTFQDAIDKAKRCEMTLIAGRNKIVSNNGHGAQMETTQLTQMMMELSKTVSEIKNEIKEKAVVDHRPRYNGSNNNNLRWNRNGNDNNNVNSNGNRTMGGN